MISLLFFITKNLNFKTWPVEPIFSSGPGLCRGWLPTSEFNILNQALICGINLPASQAKQLFVDTGLIHLMVVSGSHLVFLELLLAFLPRGGRLFFLAGYCYLTGFQAPVVRAFFKRWLGPQLKERLALTGLQIEAAAVLLVLMIYPEWLTSRSFLMSWMCGLALCAPPLVPRFKYLDLALKAYLFLLPFCWASPITVAWNTLLAPVVGLLLFPSGLVAMVVHRLSPVNDLMWRAFLALLTIGPHGEPFESFISSANLVWLPLVTHLGLLMWEVKWRRAYAFSVSPSY